METKCPAATVEQARGDDSKPDLVKGPAPTFPANLHNMLEQAEMQGFDDIIAWEPGGTAFKIKDQGSLEREVLPRFFKHSKYKSFLRQLQHYGFSRVSRGPSRGRCWHELFQRGMSNMLPKLRRLRRGYSSTPLLTRSLTTEAETERRHSAPTSPTIDSSSSLKIVHTLIPPVLQTSLALQVSGTSAINEDSLAFIGESNWRSYRDQSVIDESFYLRDPSLMQPRRFSAGKQSRSIEKPTGEISLQRERFFVEEVQPNYPEDPTIFELPLEDPVINTEECYDSPSDYEPIALESTEAHETPSFQSAAYTSDQHYPSRYKSHFSELSLEVQDTSSSRKASENFHANAPMSGLFATKSLIDFQCMATPLQEPQCSIQELGDSVPFQTSPTVSDSSVEFQGLSSQRSPPCYVEASHVSYEQPQESEDFGFEGRRFYHINC